MKWPLTQPHQTQLLTFRPKVYHNGNGFVNTYPSSLTVKYNKGLQALFKGKAKANNKWVNANNKI
jgi:hypothetical protein